MLLRENFYKRKSAKAWSLRLLPLVFLSCFVCSVQSFAITTGENSFTETQVSTNAIKQVKALIEKGDKKGLEWIAKDIFSQSGWDKHPKLVEELIKKIKQESVMLVPTPGMDWIDYEMLRVTLLAEDSKALQYLARYTFPQPGWEKHPELVKAFIEKADSWALENLARYTLSQPGWEKHPELVKALIARVTRGDMGVLKNLAIYVLSQPGWEKHPEFVEAIIAKGGPDVLESLAKYVLSQPGWEKHPKLLKALIKSDAQYEWGLIAIAEHVLSQSRWQAHPEVVKALIERKYQMGDGGRDGRFLLQAIAIYVLSQPGWEKHPDLLKALIAKGDQYVFQAIAINVLSKSHWYQHPEFIEAIIEKGNQETLEIVDKILSEADWQKHPRLIELTQGEEVNVENIKKALEAKKEQSFIEPSKKGSKAWKFWNKLKKTCS